MYYDKDIVKEGTASLNQVCERVRLPLSNADYDLAFGLYQYLVISENEEACKKYDIRPGVGIAAPQVGRNVRMFAMNAVDFMDENEPKYSFVIINPEIISKSKDITYLPGGEGCLSVTRPTEGLVTPRYKEIIAKCAILDIATRKIKNVRLYLKGYPAIVFQHEYDHLDGILYTSKMFKIDELDKDILPLYTIPEENKADE